MSGGEFALIDAIADALGPVAGGTGVTLGPGDDAAVLAVPPRHELVVSTDTLVAGRHYPLAAAANIGYRSMAVATSDLAAMGADPAWALVSLTAPALTTTWARDFAAGIRTAAEAFGLKVVGGNLARGPHSVTVAVHGHVPAGTALRRSGAQPGDRIYVSGSVGGAGLALEDEGALAACPPEDIPPGSPLMRYWRPQPRLGLGTRLRGIATAAIDVSDGVAAEVDHLCTASRLRATLQLAHLPLFAGIEAHAAVAAGDDYELVFTAPPSAEAAVAAAARAAGVPVAVIGTMQAGKPWRGCWDAALDAHRGFRHF